VLRTHVDLNKLVSTGQSQLRADNVAVVLRRDADNEALLRAGSHRSGREPLKGRQARDVNRDDPCVTPIDCDRHTLENAWVPWLDLAAESYRAGFTGADGVVVTDDLKTSARGLYAADLQASPPMVVCHHNNDIARGTYERTFWTNRLLNEKPDSFVQCCERANSCANGGRECGKEAE
jgi:hypothetical protein